MKFNIALNLHTNRIVRFFILTDLALLAGWGLIGPVFPLFVTEYIEGATVATVGVAIALYLVWKSVLQLPIAQWIDGFESEQNKVRVLLAGLLLSSIAAFSFLAVHTLWQLYLVQLIHATSFALYIPAWSGLFSRHLDRGRMAFDWSLDSTVGGLAVAGGAFFGGILALQFGFQIIFILAGVFSLLGALFLAFIPDMTLPQPTSTSAPDDVLRRLHPEK